MNSLLKFKFHSNLYLLLAAIVFFTAAYVIDKSSVKATSPSYYAQKIEADIQKKERDFSQLVKDTALLNTLVGSSYSEATLKSLLDEEKGYGFFIYEKNGSIEPRLLFWNTQEAVPPVNLMDESDVSRTVVLNNGTYVQTSKMLTLNDRSFAVEALVPVTHKYFVEIENLPTEFVSFPEAIKKVDISNSPTPFAVRSFYGNILFYLKAKPVAEHARASWWLVLCVAAGFFLLCWYIHVIAHLIGDKMGFWWGVTFLTGVIVLLRLATYLFPDLLNLRQFELFNPAIYGSSFVLSSLGDLLINSFLLCWIALFINRRFSTATLPTTGTLVRNWILATIMLAAQVALTFTFARILQSLVADAKISFNVTNFDSLTRYSFVGFVILASLALSYFFLSQAILKMVRQYAGKGNYFIYIIAAAMGLMILSFTRNSDIIELNLFVLIWLIIYIWMMQQEVFSGLRFRLNVSEVLFWLFVFSFSMAAVMVSENRKIEFEQRKLFAEKLALQSDPSNERLLSIALTYLDNDFLAANFHRFYNANENARLKDSIINRNFSEYINKFDTRIYTFDPSVSPKPLFNDDPISFDTLNTIFHLQGKRTNGSLTDMRYFERSFEKYSYISLKTVKNTDSSTLGYFIILADPKKYKGDALIPELFKQSNEMFPEYSNMYSYAVYNADTLRTYFNEYAFPIELNPSQLPKSEFMRKKNGNYEELWYRPSGNKVVVISRKNNSFIEAITLFSYLFSTFLLLLALYWVVSIVVRSRLRWSRLKQYWQFSIRMQIHSTILLISLLSFVVIGVATIIFFKNRYDRNNEERLSRAMQIMVKQVNDQLKEHVSFNDSIPIFEIGINDELEKVMEEISEIHGTDVNLYDWLGNLKVSSKPLIYNKGVLSDKMNPEAYYAMHIQKAIQTVKDERMGKVDYISVYNPIRNDEGKVYGYLNVPSYSTQDELKQEISNFLVTLINLNAFIFLVAGAIALFITNRITYSFTLIGHKMRDINLRKVNQEIDWNRNDEIGELVKEYNKMVRKLDESAEALAKSEREGAWRQMARQVAHEIKNPLTPMKLSIQYLQKAIDNNSPNVKEMTTNVARTLVEQIDHLSKIASDFSQFANIGNPRKEVFDLHEVLYSLSSLYEATDNLDFSWSPVDQRVLLFADKTQINRLFTNLLQNAVEASSSRERRIISVHEQLVEEDIIVSITDNGEGIPEQTRSKIFTPNFTTKTSGTGLGLAMSKSIIENAQGDLWFDTKEGEGTTFYVKIPLLRATS